MDAHATDLAHPRPGRGANGSGLAGWLIQTKLLPPLPRSDVVPRPRLLAALREGLTRCRLTLLSAPAGYGKTTLLASLGGGSAEIKGPGDDLPLPIAWLTLDEQDNAPVLFLAYLMAALQGLNPACGATAQAVLSSITNPGAEALRIIGVLINDILETLPDPFVLILDDLHLITEPAVFAALDCLLERSPPQMHLAVGTRHDPPLALPRLRARGQVAELGLADLRFTDDETAQFLNKESRLNLSPADLRALQRRTEGWPVGLRLLASSLDRIPTAAGRSAFITHLAHTDRYILDFLADEVLSRQTSDVRTFLLETSILSELTSALCQAVTGRADAGAILEDLDRRNLFLLNLQPPTSNIQYPTYRYHALFAAFLRRQLAQEMPERVPDLHRRAAEAQSNPNRAIGHYLAAGMWESAADMIEVVGWELLRQNLLDTLQGWIEALPAPVREPRALLARFLGVCAFRRGEFETAQSLLEQAVAGFVAAGDEARQGEALADLASSALLQGDFGRCHLLIDRALAYPIPPYSQVQLLIGRAWLGIYGGPAARTQAAADLEAALEAAWDAADPDALLLLAFHLGSPFAALPGGLEHIERFCRQVTPYLGEFSPLRVAVEDVMAFVHFWRGRVDEAIQVGKSALALNERLGDYAFLGLDAASTVAVACAARGEIAADRAFEVMLHQLERTPLGEIVRAGYLYLLGRARWLQGRLEEARQVYAQMCAAERPREFPDAPAVRARMRGLLEIADHRYAAAERTLRPVAALEQTSATLLFGSARLLLAHLYLAWERPDEALAELAPVLRRCEQEGTPGFILQERAAVAPVLRLAGERDVHAPFAAHLLDLLGAGAEPRPVLVPETGETLTPREVQVLRLVAAGASNRAIAEQLVVTERTVKFHVSNILGKLDASSRTEAAARARELSLA